MATIEQEGNSFRVKLEGISEVFTLTKDQVPKIFDLVPLLHDFQELVQQVGIKVARLKMKLLLEKQLLTLVQEQVALPLSPRMVYEVVEDEEGFHVLDRDYPISPDIVHRSQEIVEIFGKKLQLDPNNKVLQLFHDRFSLELDQVVQLVEVLSKDQLFSLPFIQHLSHPFHQHIEIHGKLRNCVVSNWYALVMPATEVHAGNQSYFNIYRVVFDIQTHKYYVETQGYLHGLSRKTQSQKLLNIDQERRFTSLDEEEMMMQIIQLSEEKNDVDPESLLLNIGSHAGDRFLPLRLLLAKRRQKKQLRDIESSVEAILNVFEQEWEKHDVHQSERLEYFFEAIANPLLFQKRVFGKEIVKAYNTARHSDGKVHREAFLGSLLRFIPSLAWKAGGWSICGGLSAGGLMTPGQAISMAHGFGGLSKFDNCLTCPSCGNFSTNGNTCTHCGYGRGELIPQPRSTASGRENSDLSRTSHTVQKTKPGTFFDWFHPAESVGIQGLLGFKESVSVSQGLLTMS